MRREGRGMMRIRGMLREAIPPILLRWKPRTRAPEYASFEEALADSGTYEDRAVVDTVADKTLQMTRGLTNVVADRQTAQNLFVLATVHPERPLHVLELGGACGATFFALDHLLPGRIGAWRVVETPRMAEAGKRLFGAERLDFLEDLEAAAAGMETRDLLFAQGVLQYLPDPVGTFGLIQTLGFDYVYVTRTLVGVGIGKPIVSKQVAHSSQHGPGGPAAGSRGRMTSQPLTIVPHETFETLAPGYGRVYAFQEGEECMARFGARTIVTRMIGLLLQRDGAGRR